MRNRALIVALAAVVLGGCGGEVPALDRSSADELHAQVAAVRSAAADGDRAKALEALDGLAGQVQDLEAGGSLAKADADALRRGIGRARRKVRDEVAAQTPTPTATATPAATPTATPAPPKPKPAKPAKPGKPPKPGKGKDHGKGKGH
jgi:hypothetical protein